MPQNDQIPIRQKCAWTLECPSVEKNALVVAILMFVTMIDHMYGSSTRDNGFGVVGPIFDIARCIDL